MQQELITALAIEAQARGVSLSELTRQIFGEWMRLNLPPGRVPHDSEAQKGVQAPGKETP